MSVAVASATTTDQTPPTAESDVGPQRSSAKNEKSSRGKHEDCHQQIDADDDDERKHGQLDGRQAVAGVAMVELGGIELASNRGPLANELVFSGFIGRHNRVAAVTLTRALGHGLGATKPPQAEAQHDGRSDDAEARGGKGCRAEERHRDGVLDRGRARQRRHRERRGSESDGCRHQSARNVGGSKQLLRHRRQHEERDEQADAAIGHHRTGEHDRQHGVARPKALGHEASKSLSRSRCRP